MNIAEQKYRGWSQGRWWYYSVHDFLFNHVIDPSSFSRWCRWTGLLDKNGKEIYESDILDVTGKNDDYETSATVVWDSEEGYWGYIKEDGYDTEVGQLTGIIETSRTTVIGNIYES